MAIPSKQIGGSEKYNLLWQISKQLDQLICIRSGNCTTTTTTTVVPITTTTTTTVAPTTTTTTTIYNCYSYTVSDPSVVYQATWIDCNGNPQSSVVTSLSYNLCARLGTVVYGGQIVNNGPCNITTLTLEDCTGGAYTAYTTSPAFAVGITIYQDNSLMIPYDSLLLGTTSFQSYKYNIVNGVVTNTPTVCD